MQSSRVRCAREKCAYAHVQVNVVSTPPLAFMGVATVWTRNCQKNNCKKHNCCKTVELLAYAKLFPAAILSVNSTLSFFTIGLTICRLATCASAICANFGSMKTKSTMLGLVTNLKMMMVACVLQLSPPNEDSTIPRTLVVKGQLSCFDASFHLLECKELVLVLLTFVDLPVLFLLPGTLVSSTMVPPACSSQDFAGSHTSLSVIAAHCGLCRTERCDPSTRPMRPTVE